MWTCKFCEMHFDFTEKNQKMSHARWCNANPNAMSVKRFGRVAWNKNRHGDPALRHTEETKRKLRERYRSGPPSTGKAATPEKEAERVRKIRERAKLSNGGRREGSGRGRKGWYKGFFCDSSYELAFVIYNIDHGIDLHRCNEVRQYIYEDRVRNYHPDFVVDGVIVEIKGYRTPQWDAKYFHNPDVKVYFKEDLAHVFEYVESVYGIDYIELYE